MHAVNALNDTSHSRGSSIRCAAVCSFDRAIALMLRSLMTIRPSGEVKHDTDNDQRSDRRNSKDLSAERAGNDVYQIE